ncbi:MAG: hypothetical protein HN742_19630 [Lentisphaerae bacterium]|nr:hypothetical protein [Lentisphaerota bacterium]MBT4815846.1 hypothetical protein [Lentisphaerota bacterium]MBT5608005.1 hypothetical protein [Lentisphaerota bacterium]MBT7060671.1 hypothetical protein [Lentisphaerota bacterium]MBT7844101.1 hypothetical protein [Lentisphaerota bacterium]
MGLFAHGKTDDQYVEAVRKSLRWARKLVFFHAASFCVAVAGIVTLVFAFWTTARPVTVGSSQDQSMMGLLIGVCFGIIIGALTTCGILAIINFIVFLRGNRKDRLLIKYHDLACAKTCPRRQHPNDIVGGGDTGDAT